MSNMASEMLSIHFSFQLNFVTRWPISMPEDGIACGLGLSPGASLPSGAGLGFIDRRPAQNLRTKGVVC